MLISTKDGTLTSCAASHEDVVKLLLLHNDVALNTRDEDGWTALMAAFWNGHEAVVKLLLTRKGITINGQAKSGGTRNSFASSNGYEGVVKLLSQNDIALRLDIQDEQGSTAHGGFSGWTRSRCQIASYSRRHHN